MTDNLLQITLVSCFATHLHSCRYINIYSQVTHSLSLYGDEIDLSDTLSFRSSIPAIILMDHYEQEFLCIAKPYEENYLLDASLFHYVSSVLLQFRGCRAINFFVILCKIGWFFYRHFHNFAIFVSICKKNQEKI